MKQGYLAMSRLILLSLLTLVACDSFEDCTVTSRERHRIKERKQINLETYSELSSIEKIGVINSNNDPNIYRVLDLETHVLCYVIVTGVRISVDCLSGDEHNLRGSVE